MWSWFWCWTWIWLRFVFQLIDISNILLTWSHFTSRIIITCPVTLAVNLTYWVITSFYKFVSFTFKFNFFRTIIYYSIIILIKWLILLINNRSHDRISVNIFIMNKDTSNFFINVSNGWFWFVNFTSNRVWRLQMTVFINISYWVITFRNNFICLTISCLDDIWLFTFFSCIIWCIIWRFRCILTRFLDFVTFRIYISDNNFTFFWCFFHFIDIRYIFIFFSNWTFNIIWSCKVTIWVDLTNSICTCWYQLISFTVVLNCIWTVIYYCVICFVDRLFIFICYWSFNSCSFSIFIVNVNTSFFIWLNKVIVHISWRFNRWCNWVVIREWWITLQSRVYFTIWCCWVIRNRSFCLDFWNFTSNDIVTVITSSGRCQWCAWSTFEWTWISM